jgi:hypothetical protein
MCPLDVPNFQPPVDVVVDFDAWFESEGGVWIAESRTPRFGIATDAPTREELAKKLEVLVLDVAQVLCDGGLRSLSLSVRWTVPNIDLAA